MTDLLLDLPISGELVDHIVASWLKRRIGYAQEVCATAKLEEDRTDAAADLVAFRHIYKYVTGEDA